MAGRKTTKTLSRVYGQQMDLLNQAKKDLANAKKVISNKSKRSALSSFELEKKQNRVKTLESRVNKLSSKVKQNVVTKAIADPANKGSNKPKAPTTSTRASIQSSLRSVGRTLVPLGVGFAVSSMYNKKDENKVEDKDRGSPSKPSKVVTEKMEAAKKRLQIRKNKKANVPDFVKVGGGTSPKSKGPLSRPKNIKEQKTTTIRKGDTYTSLANRYGTTVKKLQALNAYPDKKLPIGKTIKLR
tara:strand:+ start:984 stop:1709 length:726 start_codon:yes stop_codon:yes gene_type:complete